MKEEDNILRKVGTGNSFKVPEGYFERLTSEVMDKLPEREPMPETKAPTLWDKVKPWAYMAAMFAGAALIIRVASSDAKPMGTEMAATEAADTEMISDEYINAVVSGSMIDDYSLYVYLTDAGADIN